MPQRAKSCTFDLQYLAHTTRLHLPHYRRKMAKHLAILWSHRPSISSPSVYWKLHTQILTYINQQLLWISKMHYMRIKSDVLKRYRAVVTSCITTLLTVSIAIKKKERNKEKFIACHCNLMHPQNYQRKHRQRNEWCM